MKSFIKKISLFVITIFSFFVLYSQNVNAISFQTSYINVDSPQSFYVNGLTFSDITFKDLSSTSTKSSPTWIDSLFNNFEILIVFTSILNNL